MSNSWAFNQLNLLTPSPGTSPVNGSSSDTDRNEFSLSFPVDGTALQGQLEAWTNVSFGGAFGTGNSDGLDPVEYKGMGPNDDLQQLLDGNLLGVGSFTDLYGSLGGQAGEHLGGVGGQLAHQFGNGHIDTRALQSSSSSFADIPPANTPAVKKSSAAAAAKKRRQSSSTGSDTVVAPTPAAAATTAEGSVVDDDTANALAVEEDKRRRNTAASARFRVKKKQREAALESTAKELRDRVQQLELEVESLKTENGWLRGLIVDKADMKIAVKEESSLGGANKRARIESDGESGPEQETVVA